MSWSARGRNEDLEKLYRKGGKCLGTDFQAVRRGSPDPVETVDRRSPLEAVSEALGDLRSERWVARSGDRATTGAWDQGA